MSSLESIFSSLVNTTSVFSYNWIFLVCFVVIIIAIIFYAYYFNRLFAFVFTKLLNFVLFKRFHIIIDIEALHVSLLFGTVQFKNLAIITKDSTVSIVQGTFQWKFWMLRSWLSSSNYYAEHLDQEKQHGKTFFSKDIYKLVKESRNFINIEGLEIFIYNCTSAYQRIFNEVMTERDREILMEKFPVLAEIFCNEPTVKTEESINKKTKLSNNGSSVYNVSLIDQLLDSLLPFVINIKKGSLVIGTTATKYLLVTHWDMSQTLLHGIKSENSLDLYQVRLNTSHDNLNMILSPNPLYKNTKNIDLSEFSQSILKNGRNLINFAKHRVLQKVNNIRDKKKDLKKVMKEQSSEWKGLAMYINMINFEERGDNLLDIHDKTYLDNDEANVLPFVEEYAKYSTLLECSHLSHVYYFDIPGYIPDTVIPTATDYQGPEIGNSGSAPEMRLDIQLSESQIIIGPWAYRNIMPIINLLFPKHSRDNKVAEILRPGDRRSYTRFQLFVDIQENCNFRIPTREQSKDAEFISESELFQKSKMNANLDLPFSTKLIRPYGWIDLEVSEGTSFFFDFNYFPIDGQNKGSYSFDLLEPKITTSVNHEILYSADFHSLIWESLSPLAREETIVNFINQTTNNSKCNLLREHINLITDLVNDFSVPIEEVSLEDQYQVFAPQDYNFIWRFKDGYNLMIAVNDENIINSASEYDENNTISFVGDSSEAEIYLPFQMLQQTSNNVDFNLKTRFYDICLTTPPYSTISGFSENNRIARGRDLEVSGHFEFFNELNFGNIDNLELIFDTEELNVLFYGFVIKYFTNFYENLFGETSRFKTADEYQEQIFQNTERISDVLSSPLDIETFSLNAENKKNISNEASTNGDFSTDSNIDKIDNQDDQNPLVLNKDDLKRTENELDISVKFNIKTANLYFPEKLLSLGDCLGLHTENMSVDIRALDYYFDLQIDAEPIYICEHPSISGSNSELLLNTNFFNSNKFGTEEGILTHLNCHNHRLAGPVPINDSYFSKWDFSIGKLMLDSKLRTLSKLTRTILNFDFSLDDFDNTLIVDKIESYGLEFDLFEIEGVDIKFREGDVITKIIADGITFDYQEYEKNGNSSVANVIVDLLEIVCEKGDDLVFKIQTEVNMEKTFRYSDYKKRKQKQKQLLIKNDAPFHRIWFLLPMEFRNYYIYQNSLGFIKTGQSIPNLPTPITNETGDSIIEDYINFAASSHFSLEERKQLLRKKILTTETLDLYPLDNSEQNDSISDGKNKRTMSLMFDNVKTYLDIAHLDVFNILIEELAKNDCEGILDSIYVDIVKNLYLKEKIEASDNEFDVVVESSTLKVVNTAYSKEKYVILNTSPISTNMELLKRFELKNNSIASSVTKKFKLSTKKMSLSLHDETNHNVAMNNNIKFVLESLDYDLKNDGQNDVKNFHFGTFNNLLNLKELEIFFEMFTFNINALYSEINSFVSNIKNIQNTERELVLQLLSAGNQYEINYDPPAISKLSPIVRLSKTHVRENRSWRICARLKHIYRNVPEGWESSFMNRIEKNEFTPQFLAREQFFDCFKKWINIEKQVTDSTYLYRRIFLNENNVHEVKSKFNETFELFFKSVVLRISSQQDKVSDSVIFKKLKFSVGNDADNAGKLKINSDFNFVGGRIGLGTLLLLKLKKKLMAKLNKNKLVVDTDDSLTPDAKSVVSAGASLTSQVNEFMKFILAITIKKVKLDFDLDNQILEIINHDTKLDVDLNGLEDFSVNVGSGLSNLAFKRNQLFLLKSSISDLSTVINRGFNKTSDKNELHISTEINTLNFINPEDMVKTVFILENIYRTFEKYKDSVNDLFKDDENEDKSQSTTDFTDVIHYKGLIKNLKTSFKVLHPLIIETKTSGLSFSVVNTEEKINMLFAVESFTVDVSSINTFYHYLLVTQKKLHIVTCIHNAFNNKDLVCDLDFSLSKCKFLVSDLRSIGEKLVHDLLKVTDQINFIKDKIDSYGFNGNTNETEKVNSHTLFNIGLTVDYIGLLFDFSAQQLICEMTKNVFGIKNYHYIDAVLEMTKNSLWYYAIDSLSASINDKILDQSQSKIFDTSFSGFVSETDDTKKLDFNLESEFFNVMFTPYSLIRLIWFVNQFENIKQMAERDGFCKSSDVNMKSEEDRLSNAATFLEKFNNIKFVSKNVSLGWIYSNESGNENNWNENGLVFGYQSLSLNHYSKKGEIALNGLFFGVTPFGKSYNFYKVMRSMNFINYVKLTILKIGYTSSTLSVNNFRNLTIDVFGDDIEIFFGENIALVAEHVLESVYEFKKMENRYINKKPVVKRSGSVDHVSDNIKLFESLGFYEIKCSALFTGGYCNILSHKDFLDSREPTISLHSPRVTVDAAYEFKYHEQFKHIIVLTTKIEDSENILYPTSVPIFQRIAKDVHHIDIFLKNMEDYKNSLDVIKTPLFDNDTSTESNINIKSILENIDIHCKVHCGSQEISLTCEPMAKVQAVLGVKKMTFAADNSELDGARCVSLFFESEKLLTKFHHIFSNSVSTYFQLSKFSLHGFLSAEYEIKEENFVITTANSLDAHVDITQIQNLDLFFDIWSSKSNLTKFDEPGTSDIAKPESAMYNIRDDVSTDLKTSSLVNIFEKYYTESTFAIYSMFILEDVKCIIDFGPALGLVTLTGNKLWFEFTQYRNWSKEMALNLNKISLSSKGRLQGLIELKGFSVETCLHFQDLKDFNVFNYNLLDSMPDIKVYLQMQSLKSSLSFDYHAFLLTEFSDWSLKILNENENDVPSLKTFIELNKIELYATALVTANLLNIYSSFEKIKSENLRSYYDILHESNTVSNVNPKLRSSVQTYLENIKKTLHVKVGSMYIQISPHSLIYPQVLIIENKNTVLNFVTYGVNKIFNEVEVSTEELIGRVTKAATIDMKEDELIDIPIKVYQEMAKQSKGGTILSFPAILTKMSTWNAKDSNTIEYIYNSVFGGLVSIKWNLGPVSFIREIWSIHAVALKQVNEARIEFSMEEQKEVNAKKSFFEEENIDQRIKKIKLNDRYEFKPLVVPIIDVPNLKDLGNATPPLKWFGINKEKFPGVIYEALNQPLGALFKEVEQEYGKRLEKL